MTACITVIKRCACSDKAHTQDDIHGKGNRVHIKVPMPPSGFELRCTVCGSKEKIGASK
jgi:hypothetical protein